MRMTDKQLSQMLDAWNRFWLLTSRTPRHTVCVFELECMEPAHGMQALLKYGKPTRPPLPFEPRMSLVTRSSISWCHTGHVVRTTFCECDESL